MTKYTRENIELQCRRLLSCNSNEIQNILIGKGTSELARSYIGLAKAYIMACDEIHELKGQLQNDEWEEAIQEKLTSDNPPRVSGLPTGLPSGEAINYDNFDKVESFCFKNAMLKDKYEFKLKCNVFAITEEGLKTTKRIYTNGEYDIEIFNNKRKEIEIWLKEKTGDLKVNSKKIYNVKFTEEPTASKKEIVAEEKQKELTFEEWKKVKSFKYRFMIYLLNKKNTFDLEFKIENCDDRKICVYAHSMERPYIEYSATHSPLTEEPITEVLTINEITDIEFLEEEKSEPVEEKLTTDNYKHLQRFGYEGAKFERDGGYTHFIAFKSKTEDAIIYEEDGKIKGKIWLKDAKNKDFNYISIEDLDELEFMEV